MGLFNSIFGSSTFDENNLVKAYKSQDSLKKYNFQTFSFLECSKHNIAPEIFFDIFMKAHEILNQKKLLTQEEYWILLDLGIYLELGEIDIVDFMARRMMNLGKLQFIYKIFITYSQSEREIISNISSQMWENKVKIFHHEKRLVDNDDAYNVIGNYSDTDREIWQQYNNELYQKVI